MSSGRQRRKKGGQRPGAKRPQEPRLVFLCDEQLPARLCREVGRLKGYRTRHIHELGLSSAKDPGVKEEAIKHKMLILTFDGDFLDPITFKVCTHPGVLRLEMTSQAISHVLPRIEAWLRSANYHRSKHALVQLRDEIALVTSKKGREPEIRYYPPAG